MKKLMILAAVAVAAIATQAATYTWKAAAGYVYGDAEGTTKVAGTAYLFNAGTYSQETLLAAFYADGFDMEAVAKASAVNYVDGAFVGGAVASGRAPQSASFNYDGVAAGSSWDGYFAMIVDDKLYISSEKTGIMASGLPTGTDIAMGTQSTSSKIFYEAGADYAGAGWYTAAAIPEPTSGLLLLLGMAGLALRRKQK